MRECGRKVKEMAVRLRRKEGEAEKPEGGEVSWTK
jgi:hypothetical protein